MLCPKVRQNGLWDTESIDVKRGILADPALTQPADMYLLYTDPKECADMTVNVSEAGIVYREV